MNKLITHVLPSFAIVTALLSFILLSTVSAGSMMQGDGMMHGRGMMMGCSWMMMVLWILAVIVLILGAAALVKYLFSKR